MGIIQSWTGHFSTKSTNSTDSWNSKDLEGNQTMNKHKSNGTKIALSGSTTKEWIGKIGFLSSLSLGILGFSNSSQAAQGIHILNAVSVVSPGIPNKASVSLNKAIESHRRGNYEEADKLFKEVETLQKELLPAELEDFKRIYSANKAALEARNTSSSTLDLAEDLVSKGQSTAAGDLTKKIAFDEQYLKEADKARFRKIQETIKQKSQGVTVTSEPILVEPVAKSGGKFSTNKAEQPNVSHVKALMAQGDFEAAESLISELPSGSASDPNSPAKLKQEIARMKQDPKALMTLARKAYSNMDLDAAENLAKIAEKNSYAWTFTFASDSPAKLLKDIQVARGKTDNTETKSVVAKLDTPPLPIEPKTVSKASQNSDSSGSEPNKGDSAEVTRSLVKEARKALADGNIEKARELTEQARNKKAGLNWWEDNPDRLQADILRAQAKTKSTTESSAKTEVVKESEDPRQLLRRGRKMLMENKLDEATRLMLRAKAAPGAKWGLFEDSPEKLRGEIEKAQAKKDREESAKILAEARKLYDDGDYDAATKAAYRAQQLHGPYNVWDLGDRPQKLVTEIEAAKLKARKDPSFAKKSDKKKDGPSTDATKVSMAQATMRSAREALSNGNYEKAAGLAFQVKGMNVKLEGETPETILKEIENKQGGKMVAEQAPKIQPSTSPEDKSKAIALMVEAKTLAATGNLVGARQKAMECQKLGVNFAPGEDSPEQMLVELSSLARNQVDELMAKAGRSMNAEASTGLQNLDAAQKYLETASSLAKSFGQDTKAIESKQNQISKTKGTGTTTTVSATESAESNQGKVLLEKARLELRSGQTVTARRLAIEAYQGPYGVKEEASTVLRSIDIEEVNQKTLEARRTFDAALSAYNRKEFDQAKNLISAVLDKQLDKDRLQKLKEIMQTPDMQPGESSKISLVKGNDNKAKPANNTPELNKSENKTEGGQDLLEMTNQMREVKFGQMRQQGLDLQRDAMEKFQAGQTDAAIEMLTEYLSELNSNDLEPGKMAFLRRPVESRLQHFKLMKAQKEMLAKDGGKEKKNAIGQKQLADENKQKKVAELMKQFNQNFKEGKYLEAESYAMRAHELDPDNAMAAAAMSMAKTQRSISVAKKNKAEKEKFFLDELNATDKLGPPLEMDKPLDVNPEMVDRRNKRQNLSSITSTTRKSEKEKEIESKLTTPVNLNFNNTLLREAIEDIRSFYGINIVPDMPALEEEGISLDRPVNLKLEQVSLKSALSLLLHSVHLTYVIKDEVLQITTESRARGKLQTVTYQVADLVVPVENYTNPHFNSLSPILGIPANQQSNQTQAPSPLMSPNSMTGGTQTGTPSGSNSNGNVSVSKKNSQTMEDMLIKLLTSTIAPQSWNNMGGPGTIEYFPLTMSLVINQSPDIQEQVADLLTALRRLQDQEVAIEVRFISIAEDFYERIGLDFNLNIKTDRNTSRFEPMITSGQYKPSGYINDPNFDRMIGGITPAGSFTSDLDIPITNTSFPLSIPAFGGYPGLPGAGGLSMGLAFLSDIQVFLFMEAAQGDQRTNVMQAPKLTLFNGQNANITVAENQFFVTGVNVQTLANGNLTFAPTVQAFPFGVYLNIQALISADRRSVRLNMPVTLTNLVPGPVSLFPVVVPIFPTQNLLTTNPGDPITFTQYIQQPVINTIQVQTTVSVPDGGTVLMGGIKRLSESRSEYGPPILSKIPYINRLFKNVGYGREAESLLIMVTPRIIIQEEEEFFQTGYKAPPNVIP